MARKIRLEVSICDLPGDPVALWHSARTTCESDYDDAAQALYELMMDLHLLPDRAKPPKDPYIAAHPEDFIEEQPAAEHKES